MLLVIFVGNRNLKIVELGVAANEILFFLKISGKIGVRFYEGVQFFSFGIQIHLVHISQFVLRGVDILKARLAGDFVC